MFKVKTPERHQCSSISIDNFEQVIAGWDTPLSYKNTLQKDSLKKILYTEV